MKNSRAASSLWVAPVVLLAASTLAQTNNPPAGNETPSSVAAARCAYTADNPRANESSSRQATWGTIDDDSVAQLPRRGPGPAFGPHRPMGRPAYPGMWQSQPSGRHALIGAVIGAGLGWAVAAKGNAGVRATLGIATVGAGLGAAIGLSVPSFPYRSPYFRRWPHDDEDDEASGRKSAKPGRTSPSRDEQVASTDATSPIPWPSAEGASSSKATTAP
jgi:hypothetical protein